MIALGVLLACGAAWFVYRWFRPSARQRAMIELHDRVMAERERWVAEVEAEQE